MYALIFNTQYTHLSQKERVRIEAEEKIRNEMQQEYEMRLDEETLVLQESYNQKLLKMDQDSKLERTKLEQSHNSNLENMRMKYKNRQRIRTNVKAAPAAEPCCSIFQWGCVAIDADVNNGSYVEIESDYSDEDADYQNNNHVSLTQSKSHSRQRR
jgi:hypothetical protein